LVDHQFPNIVHKLFPVVLFAKLQPIDLLDLAIPEIAHHRAPPLLLPYQLQPIIFAGSQFHQLRGYLDSDVGFGPGVFLRSDEQVQEMIDRDDEIAWRGGGIFAFALLALHLELLEQQDPRVEGEVVKTALIHTYLLMYLLN
jgi:hypothetical protein